MGMAVIIYCLSLLAYSFNLSGLKNLLLAICIQIALVTGLSVFLN
jgi:hypothetical protein